MTKSSDIFNEFRIRNDNENSIWLPENILPVSAVTDNQVYDITSQYDMQYCR